MVKVQQRGLGKGLSALIADTQAQSPRPISIAADKAASGVQEIAIDKLVANRLQPRTHFDDVRLHELAQLIEKNGIMQPILVRHSKKFTGSFEIIAGERRWRAARMAGLSQVPVHVRDMDDAQALEVALIENIQRQDLNPVEEAQGFKRLMEEFSYTQEELSEAVGKSRSHIANLLRVLTLPESVKEQLAAGELTLGHAKALLTSPNPEALANEIINGRLSVRQAEQLARNFKGGGNAAPRPRSSSAPRPLPQPAAGPKDPDIIALEETLSDNLGLKVTINDQGGKSGEIVIAYGSLKELDGVLKKLGGGV